MRSRQTSPAKCSGEVLTVGGWGSSSFGLATVRVLPGPRAPDTVGAAGSLCHTGSVRTVVIIGASTPLGQAALALVASRRADFLVDGLTDDGAEPRQLAELCLEFTPLRLGITDDYAVGRFWGEREDISIDRGLVDWEVADVDVVAGPSAAVEVAGVASDIAVIGLTGDSGNAAAAAALAAGTPVVLVPVELAADGLRTTSEASIVDDLMGLPAPGR